nr:LysR substrate-binding domain-containing protein [Trichococcus flocculiformis]
TLAIVLGVLAITVVGGIGPIKQLVAENCGIAFLYRISVEKELEEGTLKEIPIRRFAVAHPFHVVHLKDFRDRGPLQELLSFYR